MKSFITSVIAGTAALLTGACGGSVSQTANPPGPAASDAGVVDAAIDVTGDERGQSNVVILKSLDDACPWSPQATGRSIFAHVKSPYTATYSPVSGAPSALTITVSYAGEVRCHAPIANTTGGAPNEPARLEVIVDLGLQTADGTFAETFHASLLGPRGYKSLVVQAEVGTKSLAGTFAPLAMPGLDTSLIVSGGLDFDGKTDGHIQQFGQKSPAPSGGTSAGVTRSIGDWK